MTRRIVLAGFALEGGCLGISLLAVAGGPGQAITFVCLMLMMGGVWLAACLSLSEGPARGGKAPLAARELLLILGFALLFWATLLPGAPLFDDDIHRYLWDGRVTLAGINPYRFAPEDPALYALRDPGWHSIGYPRLPTPYPPAAQALFAAVRLLSGGTLPAAKALLGLFFAGTVWLVLRLLDLAGRDRRLVLLWAWNPLVLKEFAQSGHVDQAAIFLLLAAVLALLRPTSRGGEALAGAALAAAAAVKVFPLFAAPFLLFRARRRLLFAAWFLGVLAACYLPFMGAGAGVLGSLGTYHRLWLFNQGPWEAWEALWRLTFPAQGWILARGFYWAGVMAAALPLGVRWRGLPPAEFGERLGLYLFAVVVLSPAVMPWYLTWGMALAVFRVRFPVHAFGILASLSYLYYPGRRDMPGVRWAEYAGLALLLWREWKLGKKR